jgi:hypothetical protein
MRGNGNTQGVCAAAEEPLKMSDFVSIRTRWVRADEPKWWRS